MAEDNPDDIGRAPRVPDNQPAKAGELLAELVRLVDSPGFALQRPPPVEIAPDQTLPASKPKRKSSPPAPSAAAPSPQPKETAVVEVRPPEPRKSNAPLSDQPNGNDSAARRRREAWVFGASALLLGALAVIGSTYGWERMASRPQEARPSAAAAAQREIAPPAEETAATPGEGPVDLTAHDSLIRPPAPLKPAPATIGMAQPAAPPAHEPPAATVAAPPAAEPATAPKSPDSKAEPTAALPPEPAPAAAPAAHEPPAATVNAPPAAERTAAPKPPESKAEATAALPPEPAPTAAPGSTAADSGPGSAGEAPLPPARPAEKAAVPARRIAERTATKLDAPTKLSSQSGASVGAKAGVSGHAGPDTKTAQGPIAPQAAAPPAQPAPAPPQPKPNPVARAFGSVMGAVGAVAGLIPFAPHQ